MDGEKISPNGSTGFLIWRSTAALLRHSENVLSRYGVTHTQLVVLLSIDYLSDRQDEVYARDVQALEGLDKNIISQVLARLEHAKLVLRQPSDVDRRSICLQLTQKGRNIIAVGGPALQAAQLAFFRKHLSEGQIANLHSLLQRMNSL